METLSPTVWEAKERAELLALETDEWREKRLIAEDTSTTADVLVVFASEVETADKALLLSQHSHGNNPEKRAALLVEALVAHPNLPPNEIARLLGRVPFPASAFCRNPIAPFVFLEAPNFINSLRPSSARRTLLRQENLPVAFVKALAMLTRPDPGVSLADDEEAYEAKTHIALAGEIQTAKEGKQQLQKFWHDHAARESFQFIRRAEHDYSRGWWRGHGANLLGFV